MPGRGYIFVLWADNFEEIAATVFISELREAGLRVKLVGLTGPRSRGAHGLVLVPDLTLDQALPLACQASCLIIPCQASTFKSLKNEPRLPHFFWQVRSAQARFVINESFVTELFRFTSWADLEPSRLLVYSNNQEMVSFARKVAGLLANE